MRVKKNEDNSLLRVVFIRNRDGHPTPPVVDNASFVEQCSHQCLC